VTGADPGSGRPDGVWLATTAGGIVLVRVSTVDGVRQVRFDDPVRGRYRQPGGDDVRLIDPTASLPRPVVDRRPDFDRWCGWYRGDSGPELLLTHIPEADLGEPMVLVQQGDAVIRAYPLDARTLVREDGVEITFEPDRRLTLRRGGDVLGVLSRTDRVTEEPVEFSAHGVALRGTLISPSGPGPHPGAVVVHGAAGGQRDYYRLFVTALLAAGVAALIYDKQGTGTSGGADRPSIFDQAAAAGAALDLLAGRPDIGPVGLLGFSNGMWSVPMVAAGRTDLAFVAGIGSPGVSMVDAEVHRRTTVLRDAGVSEASVAAVARAWRAVFALDGAGPDPAAELVAELRAALAGVAGRGDLASYEVPAYAVHNPMLSPLPPSIPVEELLPLLAGPADPAGAYDPAPDYARITCPVLLQFGEWDVSVPVAESVRRIHAARPEVTIRVYPGLDHLLNRPPTGIVGLSAEETMYAYHDFRFGTGVWADLTGWLRTVTAAP